MSNPIETAYCQIDIPGRGVTVRLRVSMLERLAAEVQDVLAASGRESGGILLGSMVSGKTLVVEDYDPVPSRYLSDSRFYLYSDVDRGRMAGAVALWSPTGESRLRVVGFYRCNDRPALIAGFEEQKVFAHELGEAPSVLLLVEPGANGRTALACYFAEHGQFGGREGRIEIDSKNPGAVTAEEPAAATVLDREAKPQTAPARRERWSSGLARIAAVPLAAGLLWLGFLQYQVLKGMSAEASTARRPPVLGLEVQPLGSYWQVSWNRSSGYVAGAARGHLRIEDGAMHKDVDLDATELRTTSIIYDPAGNEIRFHLEVFGAEGGRSTAESLRVFATLPPAAPAETAARSQAAPAEGLNTAGMVKEFRQPDSPSLTLLPVR
jgi:hypothetical protein